MAVTPEMITAVRYNIGDTDLTLPILSDSEYEYFLTKESENIQRASMQAAKTILFKLSMRSDRVVDVLSISGSARTAEQYRLALQMYIKDPNLNGISASAWAGGISKSDIAANIANPDNNAVLTPPCTSTHDNTCSYQTSSNPFLI